jgi:hypothetical protein
VSAQEVRQPTVVAPIQLPSRQAMVQSRITKGAPYSAETLTESVQALSDGNRIVRRTMTRVFRDAEGRVRTERFDTNGELTTINISDPVDGHTYTLYPKTKKAYRNGVIIATPSGTAVATVTPGGRGTITTGTGPGGTVTVSAREGSTGEPTAGAGVSAGARGGRGGGRGAGTGSGSGVMRGGGRGGAAAGKATQDDLGQQVIEGVLATGTRRTTVIEAGAIGNEQPINIVSEEWFSPDLQVLVLTKHSDPRVGETTFRLSSIVRAEPARTLFEVPADYTLEQSFIRRQEK